MCHWDMSKTRLSKREKKQQQCFGCEKSQRDDEILFENTWTVTQEVHLPSAFIV